MKMITEINVAASAKRAWQVLAEDYGNAAVWTSVLESTSLRGELGVGAIRTCHSKSVGPFPASVVEERLIEFEPDSYQFTYIADKGLPRIFKSATNAWRIHPVNDNSCKITSHATLKISRWVFPISWIFPILIKRDLKVVFEELAHYIEQGQPHPRIGSENLKAAETQI
jgi:Polyketide cyclase / dehydrase and lipid transport